ncbi:MAG: DUF935 family protein [Fimbriimonadaceae bacterium]|nr:DUF935 family protein [Fimbriimonadaceae bacterium]QYK58019.1 MAG: DUF935 family protein [Fimbriimonadaceae bacterium]
MRLERRLTEEYVAGGGPAWLGAAVAAVQSVAPRYIDDLTWRDPGIYGEMLADDDVGSACDTFKLLTCSGSIEVLPAVARPLDSSAPADPGLIADAEESEALAQFVRESLGDTDPSFRTTVKALAEAAFVGSRVAEVVMRPEGPWLTLAGVRPKDPSSVIYRLDRVGRLAAIVPAGSGDALPPEKFVVFTYGYECGDVRGRSLLRRAYLPWFMKKHVMPEFLKYLSKFGSPQVVGKTSPTDPEMVPRTDPDGRPLVGDDGQPQLVTAQRRLLDELLKWRNAYAIAVRAGSEVELVESSGEGKAFEHALGWFSRSIHRAILGTAQATTEAQHESRASKQVAQDVLGLRVADLRIDLSAVLTRQLSRLLVRLNFGESAVRLAPRIALGEVEPQDRWEALRSVAGAYAQGYLHDSQLPALDASLGLPARDMAAMSAEREEDRARASQSLAEAARVFAP